MNLRFEMTIDLPDRDHERTHRALRHFMLLFATELVKASVRLDGEDEPDPAALSVAT